MKVTDFKQGEKFTHRYNDNRIYHVSPLGILHYKVTGCSGIFIEQDVHYICSDHWEPIVEKYTTQEAFKMLAEGKTMVAKFGEHYKFSEEGKLTYSNGDPANLNLEELKSMWTEYRGGV